MRSVINEVHILVESKIIMNFFKKSRNPLDPAFAAFNSPYSESYDGGGSETQTTTK